MPHVAIASGIPHRGWIFFLTVYKQQEAAVTGACICMCVTLKNPPGLQTNESSKVEGDEGREVDARSQVDTLVILPLFRLKIHVTDELLHCFGRNSKPGKIKGLSKPPSFIQKIQLTF